MRKIDTKLFKEVPVTVILKEIQLTPDDIVQAVRTLNPDELTDLCQRLRNHGLILDWAERSSVNKEMSAQEEDVPEFWKLIDVESLPEPPPPTPEGDKIALAALDKIHGLYPITDPKLGHWIAESQEVTITTMLN
jgi:hypothetical protein